MSDNKGCMNNHVKYEVNPPSCPECDTMMPHAACVNLKAIREKRDGQKIKAV